MLILCSSFISLLSVLCMIHFLYSWPETLDCTLSPTNFLTLPPPSMVFQNSLHRQFIHERSSRSRVRITLQELFSIWLGGRITSPRVWFGAGGQGVTLKLAWGPSNSSPRNLYFAFAFFPTFSLKRSFLTSFFFVFSFWRSYAIGAQWVFVDTVWYLSVAFFPFPFFYKSLFNYRTLSAASCEKVK